MSFLTDFKQLFLTTPRYNLKHVMAENCDYSDTAVKSKNCYYCFGAFYCEDVYYARYSRKCHHCSGLTLCMNCEWCVQCTDCAHCHTCDYCQNCQNCSNCIHCTDCFGSKDCLGCTGLYQKQYCMFNEQLTEKEYKKRMEEMDLTNAIQLDAIQQKTEQLKQSIPQIAVHQFSTEDCTGSHMTECKGCYECYDVMASEDCLYMIEANANQNCCDLTVCFETQWSYQCVQCPLCYGCTFCMHLDNSKECTYCAYGRNLDHCFGCVGIADKKYHILNQPVDPEQYEAEVKRIKQELIQSGQFDLTPYFITEYEQQRLTSETEPIIKPLYC